MASPVTNPTDADRAAAKLHGLAWHPLGGWARRIAGDRNRTYFGKVPLAEAVRAMVLEIDRRERGARAEVDAEAQLTRQTVREAVNHFLNHLDGELAKGAIRDAQRASYGDELAKFLALVGKDRKLADLCKLTAPEAIFRPVREAAIQRGIFAAEKHITQVRTFLDWCSSVRRFMPAPFYADAFSPPSVKEKRATMKGARRKHGVATWTPAEVREIIEAARLTDVHRYAQVLLMVNGGLGATDLSNLEDADVDWVRQCIDTDRSKTLVPRIVPLWDITATAMRESRAARVEPAEPKWAGRFFLTPKGRPLVVETMGKTRDKVRRTDALHNWMYSLLNGADREKWKRPAQRLRHLKRHRAGAYTLRSVFLTLSLGQPVELVATIAGHKFANPITAHYARGDFLEKLRGVTEHVRGQLWADRG